METENTLVDPDKEGNMFVELKKDLSGNFVIKATVNIKQESIDYAKSIFNKLLAKKITIRLLSDSTVKQILVEY